MNHQFINNVYSVTTQSKSDAIIFVHGFQGSYEDNLNYVSYFEERGIQSFSINFIGLNISSQVQQLEALIQYVSSLVNIEHIYLFGESQGGLVSLLANKDLVDRLILLYPACNLPYIARSRYSDKKEIPECFTLFDYEVNKDYFECIYDLNVWQSIQNKEISTLILHGDQDALVPYSYSETLSSYLPNAKLVCIPEKEHGFYMPFSNNVIAPIVDSFLK